MSLSTKKSIFLIQSSTTKSIGTGFVVYADDQGAYLVTCMHVVEACDKNALEVHGQKAELIKQGLIEEIDLALLYVKGLEDTEALKLCSDAVSEDTLVEIEGFKRHKKNNIKLAKLEKIDGVVKKVSKIYANLKQISTYELSIEKEDSIEQGYSGATVVLKGTNTVIAVATDRERNGKNAYAIPISYLKEIWEDMPEFITCKDAMQEKSKEKKTFLKKLEDQALNTIAGVIVMAVITGFIYDAVKPKESTLPEPTPRNHQAMKITGANNNLTQTINENKKVDNVQTIDINASNNTVKQVINRDTNTKKLCKDGISEYQKTVDELSQELQMAKMLESKKIINRELEETRKQLTAFKKNCN
ncbi:MAG: Unknown protein [uncultured Sulfurovum sp.]|uniref:Serine protease n=1 Tax=uncultured Sulfurovum sp. TaxID=269237 RepID=A0A6S6TZV5_9BACT|nr:MAG: Unknown protein [uncultured Sulfurovum sp.]